MNSPNDNINKNIKKKRKIKSILKNKKYVQPPRPPLKLGRILSEGKFKSLKYIDIVEKYLEI